MKVELRRIVTGVRMSDETFTLTDKDHDAIAQRLFDKSEERSKQEREEKEAKERQQQHTTSEIKLTDEDRKGIASHLRQMDKDEAEAAEKDKKQKEQDEKDRKDSKPQPIRHFLDRPLLGGK